MYEKKVHCILSDIRNTYVVRYILINIYNTLILFSENKTRYKLIKIRENIFI